MRLSAGERDAVKAADWLEAQVVYSRNAASSLEQLRSQVNLEGELDEEEELADHELASFQDAPSGPSERLASDAANEIQRRKALCGDAYPFDFNDGRLLWSEPERWADPYIVCLLASDREYYKSGDDTGKVFEHLTTLAVKEFVGGCAIRFGAPRDTMPQAFSEAVSKLAELTASKFLNGWPTYPTDQDLGLDVVGWKPFPDEFNNRLQIYVQCATGEGWLEEKKGEPNIDTWNGILLRGVPPVRALAIPYVVDDSDKWQRDIGNRLLLDRLRIACALRGTQLQDGPVLWSDWAKKRASLPYSM